jgi:hypothetical protein
MLRGPSPVRLASQTIDLMEQVTLTRKELFDLVWSTPMNKLAARFGLSSVGLAKTCERFHIPRPPQGHWARLAWNKNPERPSCRTRLLTFLTHVSPFMRAAGLWTGRSIF